MSGASTATRKSEVCRGGHGQYDAVDDAPLGSPSYENVYCTGGDMRVWRCGWGENQPATAPGFAASSQSRRNGSGERKQLWLDYVGSDSNMRNRAYINRPWANTDTGTEASGAQ